MRLLLVLLLCLAIPFQGVAGTYLVEPPCPMAQAVMDVSADAQDLHAAMVMDRDCCNDADTAAQTGKLCKTGQECKLGQALALAPAVHVAFARVAGRATAAAPPLARSFDPPGLWRPPTLV